MYDIEKHIYEVDPDTVEAQEALQSLFRKTHKRTVDKMIRTVDAAIELEVKESKKKCRLTWTKTGALVGFKSKMAAEKINHFMDAVKDAMGDGRPMLFAIGLFVRWRISLRGETWLTNKKDTGLYDIIDRKEIRVAQYWINDNFVYKPANDSVIKRMAKKSIKNLHSEYIDSTPMLEAMKRAMEKKEKRARG